MPIDVLAQKFDLIVIDHPWAGFCFEKNLVRDLKPLVPAAVLSRVGAKFHRRRLSTAMVMEEKLLALPIDAATPAPSWRPDLLERAGVQPPQTWAEADRARAAQARGHPRFQRRFVFAFHHAGQGAGRGTLRRARKKLRRAKSCARRLNLLRELTEPMPREIFDLNPIQVAERMTTTDDFAWNAFAYTYNNYARMVSHRSTLRFGNLISLKPGGPRLRSVLRRHRHRDFQQTASRSPPRWTMRCSPRTAITQKTIYVQAGGQPSHRAAWDDAFADQLCGGFFSGTRVTQEEAIVRPRYSGYVPLQTEGGNALQEHLRDGRSLDVTLEKLDALYRESRARGGKSFQTN